MKAAILTLYDNLNIGNKLQNFAVQTLIERAGAEAITLPYKETYVEMTWRGKIVAKIGFPRRKAFERRLQIARKKHFKRFSDMWLKTAKARSFQDADEKLGQAYDAFVTGSDQVWHNWTDTVAELNWFFIRFAPEYKRICISPSFGFDKIPEKYSEQYRMGLSGFRRLCCRESNGCQMIHEVTGKESQLLCDPTMMLDVAEWDTIAKKPEYAIPEKYMLVYFLGDISQEMKATMEHIAQSKNLEILNVYSLEYPEYYCTAPDEFLYLMRNASYVCTNSFHGCVFSILYHKCFTVLQRIDTAGSGMKARLYTLLERYGLQNRMGSEHYHDPIDFEFVDTEIEKERVKGNEYLCQELNETRNANDQNR